MKVSFRLQMKGIFFFFCNSLTMTEFNNQAAQFKVFIFLNCILYGTDYWSFSYRLH